MLVAQPVRFLFVRILSRLTIMTVDGTEMYAVLHYAGAPDAEPTAAKPSGLPAGGVAFAEFNLKVCTLLNHRIVILML